jgi:hypothetical protein
MVRIWIRINLSCLIRIRIDNNCTFGEGPHPLASQSGRVVPLPYVYSVSGAYVNLPDRAGDTNLIHATKVKQS